MNSGRAYVWARLEYDKSLPGKDFVKTAKKKKKIIYKVKWRQQKGFLISIFFVVVVVANYTCRHGQFVPALFYIPEIHHPLKPFFDVQIFSPPMSNQLARENAEKQKPVSELTVHVDVWESFSDFCRKSFHSTVFVLLWRTEGQTSWVLKNTTK